MMAKCKSCGEKHYSGVQMGESSFATATLTNISENCPKCGAISTYNKGDYFFN